MKGAYTDDEQQTEPDPSDGGCCGDLRDLPRDRSEQSGGP